MPTPKKYVTRVFVNPELKKRFLAQYPMPGALSWVTELAMQAVVDITDGSPDLQSLIGSSIEATLRQHRLQHRSLREQPDTAARQRTEVDYVATSEPIL